MALRLKNESTMPEETTWSIRSLSTFFHLHPGDLRNLAALYIATFVMRTATFAGVAVMQHVVFPDPGEALWKGLLFAVFPLAEIASVGYYGARCDRVGRKKVLVFAHVITAAAVFLFIPSISSVVPGGVSPYFVAVVFVMFGIGAASKVASTLTMVSDTTNIQNRAQLMAAFDLVTLGGLAAGFGAGFIALTAFDITPEEVLLVAGLGVVASVIMVLFFVRDTRFITEAKLRTLDLLRAVFRDRDILRLLPVYVPVIALYGYVLTFTEHLLIGTGGGPTTRGSLLVITASIGIPLVLSLAVSSRFSDKARLRRPFMAVGLLSFGGLAILISSAALPGGGTDLSLLYSRWPLVAAMSAGAGAFPPAALAYLGDIVKRDFSGTTFGVYSIIFGSGLIVGPVLGGTLTEVFGSQAFIITALSLILVAALGVAFLREPARDVSPVPEAASSAVDPPRGPA